MPRTTAVQAPPLSRRQFFLTSAAGTALLAAGLPTLAKAQGLGLEAFRKLSEQLTGKDGLDDDIAAKMLEAFKARGSADQISALLSGDADPDLENDIVTAWYSGVSPDPDTLEVLTYTDARMWDAMTYTKPMGYCGGGMGYWSEPPAS